MPSLAIWSLLLLTATLHQSQGRSLSNDYSEPSTASSNGQGDRTNLTRVWGPRGSMTRVEWLKNHGQSSDVWERVHTKMGLLRNIISQRVKSQSSRQSFKNDLQQGFLEAPTKTSTSSQSSSTTYSSPPAAAPADTLDGCILLTEEQIDDMTNRLKTDTSVPSKTSRRSKRKITDSQRFPFSKWSMPITYKFDGTQDIFQRGTIRRAMQHWMDNTCVRFQEIPTTTPFSNNHVLITSTGSGCYSYIGKVNFIPQQLNLDSACLTRFGTPVHEIGHTLGLWHEQMRSDRDDFIQVIWDNIALPYMTQFTKANTVSLGVPYNYGSVMHYSAQDSSSANAQSTMRALNPLYQQNMGQRTGLSFEDIKIINLAYCSNICSPSALNGQSCQRGGYQHPNNCSQCICPDGFSGTYCEQVSKSTYATCGGVINMATGAQETIKSPGYDTDQYYNSYQSCSWLIKAPQNYAVNLQFVGDFGLYCEYNSCYHWVEVKYKNDIGLEGPRFCCSNRPNVTITSESNEMMVVFKSNFSHDLYSAQRGFQAILTVVPLTSSSRTSSLPMGITNPVSSTTRNPSTTTSSTRSVSSVTTPSPPSPTPRTTKSSVMSSSTSQNNVTACGQLNVVVIVDNSRGVGSMDNWTSMISFVEFALSYITSQQSGTINSLALVTFSDSASAIVPSGGATVSSLGNALRLMTLSTSSNLNVSGALKTADSILSNSASSQRQVCLLVTTGGATVDSDQTASVAYRMRQKGIQLLVAGVGSQVNGTEASMIAGRDSSVVYVDNWAATQSAAINGARLGDKICDSSSSSILSDSGVQLFTCSFEEADDPMCGIVQDTSDQFDWTISSAPTPSDPTGPDFASSGQYYAYIEASAPRQLNDRARLVLPELRYNGTVCVYFHYHMFGFHVNTLKVIQRLAAGDVTVWLRSRDMGNTWHHGAVQIPMTSSSQLIFEASRGAEYSGDIGLDLITITSGSCAGPS